MRATCREYFEPLATCADYPTSPDGVPEAPDLLVTDIALPKPLEPRSPYAFSIVFDTGPQDDSMTFELWGADAKCGFGAEKLYSGPLHKGTLCVELNAAQSHRHLLMTWRAVAVTHTDIAICPAGTCR